MRFGVFMAPFHPTGQNPTLALERDLQGAIAVSLNHWSCSGRLGNRMEIAVSPSLVR